MNTNPNSPNNPTPAQTVEGPALAARLLRVGQRAADAAAQINTLSQRQSEALTAGDIELVLSILAERQPLVDELLSHHDELEPMVAAVSGSVLSGVKGITEPMRQEILRVLSRLDELVTEVSLRDANDQSRLQAERTKLGEQLAGVANSRGAVQAYIARPANTAPTPLYQDREG
ncbi:MAG: hypothetical protein IBJ18_06090 [Phycisphaerales bacterium]|nr:hypothetical protein [Phycisphaerales bacterium]